jgi:multiple sugar transport system permease protein
VTLFQLMWAWNDYLGPLICLNDPEQFPIALGLQRFVEQFVEELAWPHLIAASTLTILPIIVLFFVAQRTFIEGIAISGIKG